MPPSVLPSELPLRFRLSISGQVQGVGFRPFIYRLAQNSGLSGWVKNTHGLVVTEIQGDFSAISSFMKNLRTQAPELSNIQHIDQCQIPAENLPLTGFQIIPSQTESRFDPTPGGLTPDSTVCHSCLEELFDPKNPRYLYPFISCTQCGPRYTLVHALPFDRERTSMHQFTLCTSCLSEYQNSSDRRFHSQINACPNCGPQYTLCTAQGTVLEGNAITETVRLLRQGKIVAIKGIGGFHLCCDADQTETVLRLRTLKIREQKPFALMVANLKSAHTLCSISTQEAQMLRARTRPIVLLKRRTDTDKRFDAVAPGLDQLGIMLPYTPLHYLLFHAWLNHPLATTWLDLAVDLHLVMTSANISGEPIVGDNDEALIRLSGLADAFLLHNRPIINTVDDSVLHQLAEKNQIIRRGRGLVGTTLNLALSGPVTLALGAHLKSSFCITSGKEAHLSEPMGDLNDVRTCHQYSERIQWWLHLLGVQPERIAYDWHPDYFSSRLAQPLIHRYNAQSCAVQHHHAHLAAVAAEHHWDGPFVGIALDGLGYGTQGDLWGGELLWVDGVHFVRHGHLQLLQLPGGDRAAKEPWRMASSVLAHLGRAHEIPLRFPGTAAAFVQQMLTSNIHAPKTSSCGRLFDAAAGLLGLAHYSDYEAQAAILLEQAALSYGFCAPWLNGYEITSDNILDFSAVLHKISDCPGRAPWAAALFHATLCAGLTEWIVRLCQKTGITRVALAGGCMANRILSTQLPQNLIQHKLAVGQCIAVPPHDAAISLGQAWVARHDTTLTVGVQ